MITIHLGKNAGILEGLTWIVHPREFSGVATVQVSPDFDPRNNVGQVTLDRFWLHDVGSTGYTEFILNPKIVPVKYWPHVRCWVHRHPVGDSRPGPHNWSQTDNDNIRDTPLGSDPKLIGWSVSVVRTPYQWVGRVDCYEPHVTFHCPVVPKIDFETYAIADGLMDLALQREQQALVVERLRQAEMRQGQFHTINDADLNEEEWDEEAYEETEKSLHLQKALWPEEEKK